MTGYATAWDGTEYELPALTAWKLEYTAGVPCDSFWVRCPWQGGQGDVPAGLTRFSAVENGETVFQGVVDECETSLSEKGRLLELSGRGMAALLLDNEALAEDYGTATLGDILRDHVTPYGITAVGGEDLPAVGGFSVSTGSSEWEVLYNFARYYGGVAPRFGRTGELILDGWYDSQSAVIDDSTPVTALRCRDRRYGVLSEILVRDKVREEVESVTDEGFLARGGQCRRVLTMPGLSNYKAMRYSGQFQLQKSAAGLFRQEVTVPIPFFAKPGDLVTLARSDWDRNGVFRVVNAAAESGEDGESTTLDLGAPDIVV